MPAQTVTNHRCFWLKLFMNRWEKAALFLGRKQLSLLKRFYFNTICELVQS